MIICCDCGHEIKPVDGCGTGYGIDKEGRKVCYACCAKRDRASMQENGRATLYLVAENGPTGAWRNYVVTNWPGSLRFKVSVSRVGRHNIGRSRTDVWFVGPDGAPWWGWNCGDNQILHCKRVRRSRAPGVARFARFVG